MDGCSSLMDLTLQSCKKLTASDLAEFCAHPPPKLQTLNLSYTTMETVPDSISKLQNLKVLDLRSMAITALPPSIGDCKALTSLNLRYCHELAGE